MNQSTGKMRPSKISPTKISILFILIVYCAGDIFESMIMNSTIWERKDLENSGERNLAGIKYLKDPFNLGALNNLSEFQRRQQQPNSSPINGDHDYGANCGQTHSNGCSDSGAEQSKGGLISRQFGLFELVSAIRLVGIEAPKTVQAGQPITLKCLAESKRDKLHSLSWYKNGKEFYRFEPYNRRQPVLTFNTTGVSINTLRSRNSTVILTNTTSETSGRYKCEVTGASFQEAHMEAYVTVLTPNSGCTALLQSNWAQLLSLFVTLQSTVIIGLVWKEQ